MGNNLKYTLQKHKSKIWIASSVLLAGGIGVGSYLLYSNPELFGKEETFQGESIMANHIVTGDKEGQIRVIETKDGTVVETVDLGKSDILFSAKSTYDSIYTYDGKTVQEYPFSDGKLQEMKVIAELGIEGATAFKTDGINVAILHNEGKSLTYLYQEAGATKTKTFTSLDEIHEYSLSEGVLTYTTGTTLHSFASEVEHEIDLGDTTDTLFLFENKLLLHNRFGSGLDNSVLMQLEPNDLRIDMVEKTEAAGTNLIPIDKGDSLFYTTQYVSASEPYHLLHEWSIKNGQLVKDTDKAIKIAVGKDGMVYDDSTTVGSKGYLYTHYKDTEQIYDIRSQEKVKSLKVETDFSMPILDAEWENGEKESD